MILLAYALAKELAFWKPRPDVTQLIIGVGPVEASCAVTAALARSRYALVVNAGIGGSLAGAAQIGEGTVVCDERFELALESGQPVELPDGEQVVDTARSDSLLVARLRAKGFPVRSGITVSQVTWTQETADRRARLGAQVESMEGFAVLRAAQRAGIPAIELRGISNRCGPPELQGWDFEAGVAGLQPVVDALFTLLDETPGDHR
jgi:futalosine hydrolase